MKSHFLQNLKHLSPTHHGSSWIGFYTYDVLDWVEKTPPQLEIGSNHQTNSNI